MANQHAPLEALPCKVPWRLQAAWVQEDSCIVHDVGVAVYHRGFVAVFQFLGDVFEGCFVKQFVAGIEEHNIVTCYEIQSLVHGVIQAVVFLTVHYNAFVFLCIILCHR